MIKEIYATESITYEYPPDGSKLPIIDPYDGCTINCPYCFQQSDNSWNKDLIIKMNIADLLKIDLSDWDKSEVIYIGSRCDPYMSIEGKYGLTQKCLAALNELNIPVMLATKADTDFLFRDIDIIKAFGDKFTLLIGISNLNQILLANKVNNVKNIEVANELHRMGINVWAFLTPIIPGITDVAMMVEALNPEIPVYLDKLRFEDKVISSKMKEFIQKNYPKLLDLYVKLIETNDDAYYVPIREQFKNSERVKFVFG